jgi:O-antigen/teichoic acid export membrane protein
MKATMSREALHKLNIATDDEVTTSISPGLSDYARLLLVWVLSILYRFASTFFHPAIWRGLVVLVDQGLYSITNFLAGVFVARICGKTEYGFYILGFTLLVIIMDVQFSLSGAPFTVFSPSLRRKNRRVYLGSTLIYHIVISAIAVAVFILAGFVTLAVGGSAAFVKVLLALAAASASILLRDFIRLVLLAKLQVWASLLMGLFVNTATIGVLLWAYFEQRLTPAVVYLTMGCFSGSAALVMLFAKRKKIGFVRGQLRSHIHENWCFGKWLVARTAARFLTLQIYPWIILAFESPAAAGVYGACMSLATAVNPVLMGVSRYLGPSTAHAACHGRAAVRRTVNLAMIILLLPMSLFVFSLLVFGEWALVKIFGPAYAGAGPIVGICAIAMGVELLACPIISGLQALRKPVAAFQAELLGCTLAIFIGIPAVSLFGPTGAAVGMLLSSAARRAYHWVYFQRLTSGALPELTWTEQKWFEQ